MNYRQEIIKILEKETKLNEKEIEALLEKPPSLEFGDFAFPCFVLSKKLKKAPHLIAEELLKKIKPNNKISKIEVKGPYLNFFINKKLWNKEVIEKVLKEGENYGKGKKKKEKIMIEYPAPNTNKPLHLGHVRNMLLGKSLANILESQGYKIIHVNLNNDRGIHICKSMLAYKKWGKNKQPNKKSDRFVGDFYVLYTKKAKKDEKLEIEAYDMLKKWEEGDKETRALWKKMNSWAMKGFNETYKKFGIKFDKTYNESEHYEKAKDIVLEAYKKRKLKKDEQENIIVELERYGLPNKILLRADKTAVYMTQDINLAKLKYDDFKMDRSIHVVGSEQNLHFKQLFRILKIIGFKNTEGLHHLSYGMIYLPEGKMKSREGSVVDADDLIDEIISMAKKEVKKRHKLSNEELEKRSKQIGFGALKFFILKYEPAKDFVFNPKESISFEGETGPYIQYAHARISSILDKSKDKPIGVDYSKLNSKEEQLLISKLAEYPKKVEEASNNYKPSLVSRYLLELAQNFNEFYHEHPILRTEPTLRGARIALILAIKRVLKNGLALLGIEAPEKM
ncbi:MAG: arginine--tRNA ligase [Nanoarchaeota archaeon]|nr:arginine--tRNA ligase [DPANN group archaeon]MBL7116523.1 arginine--tRNA ligase [Nanoarchaeota archaeon]